MNIVLYNHETFFRLVLYCIAGGIVSAALLCTLNALLASPMICKCKNFGMCKQIICDSCKDASKIRIILDICGFLISAVVLLLVTFTVNSGSFRLMSIPLCFLGFEIGKLFLRKLLISSLLFIIFIAKSILQILISPITLLIRLIYRSIKFLYTKARSRRCVIRIEKYTKMKYNDDIKRIKHGGLIDNFFEVV